MAAPNLVKALVVCYLLQRSLLFVDSAIGINWGTRSSHKLPPPVVVDLLKENRVGKVKLFEADPDILRALMGSGIEVMVGIPNELLGVLGSSPAACDQWVSRNVSRFMDKGGADIRCVIRGLRSDFPQDYAFFEGSSHPVVDGQNVYYNAFDGNFDTLVAALDRIGYGQMPIAIGEVGWPSDGTPSANLSAARVFVQGLINHVLNNNGTPLRPGVPPADIYLFSLLDEDQKSILPGSFERHWGIFSFDGQAKYPLNLGLGNAALKNAKDVPYLPPRWCIANPSLDPSAVADHMEVACNVADCTTLFYGGSCNAIGEKGNTSYAFNSYYQLQKQDARSCNLDGLGMVTFLDPSIGDCHFLVGISDSGSPVGCTKFCGLWIMALWILCKNFECVVMLFEDFAL
ncbi:hypothetical protein B296_00012033 [Ensete ventricosum]|uniref:X8 domain-containing protein n=1 Tax=Ensete ventricosum TaxID=4639 RepID=A0A427B390_ENSVE|nr:hypothetical protein B296_00012033 [Ensete ventricosum]